MGIFASDKTVKSLSKRLDELEGIIRELRTARKHLELEWEELYDKVRHQMSRMSRRVPREDKSNGEIPPIGAENVDEDELDPISAKIHERRNRGFLTK